MIGPQLEELPLEEWLRLLRCQTVGRIAVVVGEFPVVIPVNYRLADIRGRNWIVIRSRPGTGLDRTSLHGAFEIDGVDPAHHQGWSVLVRGALQRLDPHTGDLRTCFDPGPMGPIRTRRMARDRPLGQYRPTVTTTRAPGRYRTPQSAISADRGILVPYLSPRPWLAEHAWRVSDGGFG